ncbi:hypothetical protein LTR85_003803 [Meristemomyces frigidus]|nr:hypothetical protein LTR85_003803 [Meristemomyces frigidus]
MANIRSRIAAGLPELIIDPSHPRFLHPKVMDDRVLHAVHEMATETATNPKARISTKNMSTKYHVSLESLRDAWKAYKAEDRILTSAQEDLLCQRLDRLTRYGGKAKALEEPCRVEMLIEKYAIGVLRLLEPTEGNIAYSLQPYWVRDFLSRNPQYHKEQSGPSAPTSSTHPQTSAADTWLLPHQKAALYNIIEKHYPLRSSKGLEEYWKTIRRLAKQQIGYEFLDLTAQNESMQRQHRTQPPAGLRSTALGKRKRDGSQAERTVDWRVWDTACNDFLSVGMAVGRKMETPPCSPPPGLEAAQEEDQASYGVPPATTQSASSTTLPSLQWPAQAQALGAAPYRHDNSGYFTVDDPYRGRTVAPHAARTAYEAEDADIRLANAMGSLARAKQPNAAATSRQYELPERLLREKWAPRWSRRQMAAERLLKDQERRLHSRLQTLVLFGGNVMPIEASQPESSAAMIVQAYADGILAEDDQLVEGNMFVHANWAADFVTCNPRYISCATGLRG